MTKRLKPYLPTSKVRPNEFAGFSSRVPPVRPTPDQPAEGEKLPEDVDGQEATEDKTLPKEADSQETTGEERLGAKVDGLEPTEAASEPTHTT
jgi:hypothetical protein